MSKILVPVDFSENSLIAYDEAIEIAKHLNCDLVLVYVYETNVISFIEESFFSKTENKEVVESALKLKLQLMAKKAQDQKVKIDIKVLRGKPHKEIVEYAEKIKAKFIVMGAHGETGVQVNLMGSNTIKVVGHSSIPVFTFKVKKEHQGFDEIILPLDLSKETKQKVKYAIEIAKAFKSSVTVCSVLYHDKSDVKDRLEAQLNEVKERIKARGINCESKLLLAEYLPKGIIDFAESGGANGIKGDLILIMTQQEKSIGEYFIGSFARKVLSSSLTPVLSISPKRGHVVYEVSGGF